MASPDTGDIRKYLTSAYNDEELTIFCADNFPVVRDKFTSGMTKTRMIDLLLDHCQHHNLRPKLRADLERDRPEQYKQRFPEDKLETKEPPPPPPPEPKKRWSHLPGWAWAIVCAAGLVLLVVAVVGLIVFLAPCSWIAPTRVSGKDGMVMACVPAGEFLMGSSDVDTEASGDEKPQHRIYLDAFWIDRTEVTKDQYQRCVAAGRCKAPGCVGTGKGDHPVVCVSWQDAVNYCAWAGRRLPREAEWEKAARGTDGQKYPWGNQDVAGNLLNFCDINCSYSWKEAAVNDGYAETAPVGSYPAGASPNGVWDMAGNVWEWVADRYNEKYYASSPAENPQGPDSGDQRVLRGGSRGLLQRYVRAAVRHWDPPDGWLVSFGFRCARSP